MITATYILRGLILTDSEGFTDRDRLDCYERLAEEARSMDPDDPVNQIRIARDMIDQALEWMKVFAAEEKDEGRSPDEWLQKINKARNLIHEAI